MRTTFACCVLLASLIGAAPLVAQEDDEGEFQGSIELIYRNVSQDGSSRKYDEDFDGLSSGTRLANFSANWLKPGAGMLDYARLEVSGLGGDPFERTWFRVGRKDAYELSVNHTKQSYIYDLFELVSNEDGAAWNAERRQTELNLKVHATEKLDLIFQFQQGDRSGSSLFMKDIERQIFRFETPLDAEVKRYTVGANCEVGPVDIVFRQTLRRYDNQFNNRTEQDLGVELGSTTSLTSYDWLQKDSGGGDWTTLKIHAPLGDRADLTLGLYGTFLGEEKLESRVNVNALGTSFSQACTLSGASCGSDLDCEPVSGLAGDVCAPRPFAINDGFNNADLEGDTTMIDASLTVAIVAPLDLHLQYRELDRDLEGTAENDLDGSGASTTVNTRNDYTISTSTVMLDYRPVREIGVRVGFRTIDRELNRTGFLGVRNIDFDSGDDETAIVGLTFKPVRWFKLNADYEDGDVPQPFNAVAPAEREHTRFRAVFLPQKEMKIDLSYLDFERVNTAPDIRDPSSNWDGRSEGTTWSGSFWHKASERIDYLFRYSEQDVESSVGITFDQAGFGAVETGDSIFDNDNTQYSAHVNFSWADPWRAFVRMWYAESDGDNLLNGDTSGLVNNEMIDQEFTNAEGGLTYTFPSGVFVGGTFRYFDYDDLNNLLDYDGEIFTVRLGTTF